ncbi:pyruvate dehydrogenase (acetyl-transferring) E1 component subunit alpha [Streptacidiphilus sp. PB12-B1b]|uniref:pyruvate dehydrogenase (acetyl-transferring) E1 component subunit alpha n=1 Tax=Streptacidiphilus sp. PB12-B1b TaxID=2705012 RepID=UPI0015F7C2C0|nr:pyruvate dehydrogenase (acetyl-transferring) E1 component subunit alpha [Streptacidiphilus sp. PB12-B1b]QMU74445.1 pyruvate dehydrogenase (acetyl-transferring) E1 component subunit alpha [Streptacidiphilus sp. PB12-B1b]
MTVLDHPAAQTWPPDAHAPRRDPAPLLPDAEPVRVLGTKALAEADPELLRELYRRLVVGRRYNQQATTLTKQGSLAVYPSSTGQEACQIAAATALRATDWLFPSYRDTLAVVSRGVDPLEALTLLRGNAHSGYDPYEHRIAPLSTPLATQAPHAVGLAHAARLRGEDTVALALVGDGGTSEGDFHEALNFAGVLNAPVVFLVQNNGYAISVPLSKQSAAPTLAHKAVGYGIHGRLVDGNDAVAVHSVLSDAVAHARSGKGPVLVEAITYRLEAHTNADDAGRYRTPDEVAGWQQRDPLPLMERHLREAGVLGDAEVEQAAAEAEALADRMRAMFHVKPELDPLSLFTHVYAEPTPQLREQAAQLAAELAADAEAGAR